MLWKRLGAEHGLGWEDTQNFYTSCPAVGSTGRCGAPVSAALTFRLTGRMTGQNCLGLTPDRPLCVTRANQVEAHCCTVSTRSFHSEVNPIHTAGSAVPNLLIPQGDPNHHSNFLCTLMNAFCHVGQHPPLQV